MIKHVPGKELYTASMTFQSQDSLRWQHFSPDIGSAMHDGSNVSPSQKQPKAAGL